MRISHKEAVMMRCVRNVHCNSKIMHSAVELYTKKTLGDSENAFLRSEDVLRDNQAPAVMR